MTERSVDRWSDAASAGRSVLLALQLDHSLVEAITAQELAAGDGEGHRQGLAALEDAVVAEHVGRPGLGGPVAGEAFDEAEPIDLDPSDSLLDEDVDEGELDRGVRAGHRAADRGRPVVVELPGGIERDGHVRRWRDLFHLDPERAAVARSVLLIVDREDRVGLARDRLEEGRAGAASEDLEAARAPERDEDAGGVVRLRHVDGDERIRG